MDDLRGFRSRGSSERMHEPSVDLGSLLYLSHREAAGYQWGYLWGAVRNPETSDYPPWDGFRAARVSLRRGDLGVCVVTTGTWGSDRAVASLAASPASARDGRFIKRLLSISAELGAEL